MKDLSILIIDDEESIRHMLTMVLRKEGWAVKAVDNGQEGLKELLVHPYDIVLCDVRMPKLGGLELLDELASRKLPATVIVMSAFGSRELAIDALKRGAYDYLDKPFKKDEIILTILKAAERLKLRQENALLKASIEDARGFEGLIGTSDAMREVFRLIARTAESRSTILITGESGTGKELVARAIHRRSSRAKGPWIAVNCGAIPENLLESELFGHVKGAFTDASSDRDGLFKAADGGTLFLDEIAELPLSLQVKLLRVIQEGEVRRIGESRSTPVDVRLIAASHHDLAQRVEQKLFREDLFYRLNVIQITMPALRERPEDVPLLVERFLTEQNQRLGTRVQGVTPKAMKLMMSYAWPGNVRELQNCIERGAVLCEGHQLDEQDLPAKLRQPHDVVTQLFASDELSIKKMNAALERVLIKRALEKTGGNRTNAAKLLEISHRALIYKIKDYDLESH
jgi:two-component system, NtrC family, response regulator AtoC